MHLQVTSATMCNEDRTLCNSIAALNYPATAAVSVMNTGTAASSFTVTLRNCTHPVVDMGSKIITLEPRVETDVEFGVLSCPSLSLFVSFFV